MHDVAAFLRAHPPFNSLDDETLARVAESAEIEFFAARNFVRFITQVEHQVAQLRAGEQPDNLASPKASCR
jgi:signal-transduction protein with cAMP-binding, CBS, and nucleotidyltransferase domain